MGNTRERSALFYIAAHANSICRWSPLPRTELFDLYLSGVYRAEYAYFAFVFMK